jgi:hypothetical protein
MGENDFHLFDTALSGEATTRIIRRQLSPLGPTEESKHLLFKQQHVNHHFPEAHMDQDLPILAIQPPYKP